MAFDLEGLRHRLDDAASKRCGVLGLFEPAFDNDELVAAEPRNHVGIARDLAQAVAGASLRTASPISVPERIVHALEAVQVDTEHADDLALRDTHADVLHVLLEEQAIGEAVRASCPARC